MSRATEGGRYGVWARVVHVILALHALSVGLLSSGCSKSAADESAEEKAARPVPVQVATVGSETLRPTLQLTGRVTVDPAHFATVSAAVDSIVESVPVVAGQHVSRGDTLVLLDRRAAEQEVARAGAIMSKAQAVLDRLKAGPRPQEIEAAAQELQARRIDAQVARSQLDAKAELRDRNMISAVEWQETQRRLDSAQAAERAAEARLDLLAKGTRPEEIAEARADLDAAKADLELSKLRLQWHTVTAPIDGEIGRVDAHPGMKVAAGQSLVQLLDLREVLVELIVPAPRLAGVDIGGQAQVTLPAFPDRALEGRIARRSPQAAPETGNLPIWISVANSDGLLRDGMTVSVQLALRPIHAQAVVPESAIADLEGQTVVGIVRDGKAYTVPVKVGQRVAGRIEILEGLKDGEIVMTAGGYGLPDGQPVSPQPAANGTTALSTRPAQQAH